MSECNHEFMVTAWEKEVNYERVTELMCKRCLFVLDHENLIAIQNIRSEKKRLAKEELENKKKELMEKDEEEIEIEEKEK